MLTIALPLQQFHQTNALRMASCVEITRTDNVIHRFTDHDHNLTLSDGTVYKPTVMFNVSASHKNLGVASPDSMEGKSVIDSNDITFENLRAGLYRNATVRHRIVNWQYPWTGVLYTNTWLIRQITQSGEIWDTKLDSLMSRMDTRIGRRFTRLCIHDLGDSGCQWPIVSETARVGTIIDQRKEWTTPLLAGTQSDNFYKFGKLTWTSGQNNGLSADIGAYTDASGTIKLRIPSKFDLQSGDNFTIIRGCDKTLGTCNTKFLNTINFGGFPYMPGNNEIIRSR